MIHNFTVEIDGVSGEFAVKAKTRGAAARKVFRMLIRNGRLKNQPRSNADGWFEGVYIS